MKARINVYKTGAKKPVETYEVPDGSWVQTELLGAQHVSFVTEPRCTFKNGEGFVILEPIDLPKADSKLKFTSVQMISTINFGTATSAELDAFTRAFYADMKAILKPHIKRIEFHKGYYEISGFFETVEHQISKTYSRVSTIYYFNTGDLRWGTKQYGMLIRTAKDFKDYTGGRNQNVMYDENFAKNLLSIIGAKGLGEAS